MLLAQAAAATDPFLSAVAQLAIAIVLMILVLLAAVALIMGHRRYRELNEKRPQRERKSAQSAPRDPWRESGQRLLAKLDREARAEHPPDEFPEDSNGQSRS